MEAEDERAAKTGRSRHDKAGDRMSQYVLSATLEMRDKMTAAIKTAKKNVSGFKTSVVGSLSAVDRLTTANGRLAASAVKSAAEIKRPPAHFLGSREIIGRQYP